MNTCINCGSKRFLEDYKQGDIICKNCGFIIESHIIDFGSEWRIFSDDNRSNNPVRIGLPENPLLGNSSSTLISKGLKGSNKINEKLLKAQNQNDNCKSEKYLASVFSIISFFLTNGSFSKLIKEKVQELFKNYYDYLTLKSNGSRIKTTLRKKDTFSIIAASIFIICKNESIPRSFKEISELTKVKKKDIGNRVRIMEKALEGIKISKKRDSDNFISRFCSKLGLSSTSSKIAEQIANFIKDKEGMYGRNYISVAAASIYVVSQIPNLSNNCNLKKIIEATGVSEITLRSAYKAMYPYRKEILLKIKNKESLICNSVFSNLTITN
ncbi:transcription initiation factor IIB (nucleomorph) [Guillardia theta]|uniref:General transcription factor TFIIB n=1 Tax=Guillardia theta TaxID=55529 RepID=Q98S45_GUITH|nr:transcription initiation factor IIB [Guillardia theta]AAK39738.1 transcription initiation factor IIB [Guillardia theta]|mmetsp:Transcript_44445/g.140252  ORF Transcript_44445/g.140252 Transcript_44445/m.140252 type:complete len:326 (-) Transcript_44445:1865-2842(-)